MKIKTKRLGVFYKKDGEWKGPIEGRSYTKKGIRDYFGSVKEFLKKYRKYAHRRLKLKRMVWI